MCVRKRQRQWQAILREVERSPAGIISNCADEEKFICSHGEQNTGRLNSALQNALLLTSFPPGPQLTGKEGGRQKNGKRCGILQTVLNSADIWLMVCLK